MAKDDFHRFGGGLEAPASDSETVTPHDTDELRFVSRSLYIGVSGAVAVYPVGESTKLTSVIYKNVPVGVLPVRVNRVLSTGTSASEIIAMW